MVFKLVEENRELSCFINDKKEYKFIRDKNTRKWNAYKVEGDSVSDKPADSDKYRYDLAERLDLSKNREK